MFFPPSSTINSKQDALRIQKGLASVFDVVPLFCARMRFLVLFVCSDGGGGGSKRGLLMCVCVCVFLDIFLHFFHLVAFRGVRGRQCQIKTAETLLVSLLLFLFISFFVWLPQTSAHRWRKTLPLSLHLRFINISSVPCALHLIFPHQIGLKAALSPDCYVKGE